MKIRIQLILLIVMTFIEVSHVAAQSTAFTYQGQLQNNGSPASGSYNLTFSLYTNSVAGTAVAGPVTNNLVGVTNGLFTVQIDFGVGVFTGTTNWLQIGVESNGGAVFTTLMPRQQITPTPYAIFAATASNLLGAVPSAGISGTYASTVTFNNGANTFDGTFVGDFFGNSFIGGNFTGQFLGSGAGLTSLNASQVTTGVLPFGVLPGFQNPYNTISGGIGNQIGGEYSTIAGGLNNQIYADNNAYGTSVIGGGDADVIFGNSWNSGIVGGQQNVISNSDHSFIGGGQQNTIGPNSSQGVIAGGYGNSILSNAPISMIGGGYFNQIYGDTNNYGDSVIAGGDENTIYSNSWTSVIAGGFLNSISSGSAGSFIGGGASNHISGQYAVIPGGFNNSVQGTGSFAAGVNAQATNNGAFVWADSQSNTFGSTTSNQFSVRAQNGIVIQAATNSTALELRTGGAIKITGAGLETVTPVFIHQATAANINSDYTIINSPLCNSNPNAILIVTPNWNPGGSPGIYNTNPIGVFYIGTNWAIFNENSAAMPTNSAYNVLVFKP